MKPTRFILTLLVSLAALTGALRAAAPLILANPTNVTAYYDAVGAANVTTPSFKVVIPASTPSPTYLWYKNSTASNSGGTALSDGTGGSGTVITGSATALLKITNMTGMSPMNTPGTSSPTPAKYYYCAVTSGGVTVNTQPASLTIFTTAGQDSAVSMTVSPSSVPADYTGNITVTLTGLNTGERARFNRFTLLGISGAVQAGDPLVQSFNVTDGVTGQVAGHTDPDIPGDDDAVSGQITTHFTLANSSEMGRGAASYIIRAISPAGWFVTIDKPFTITAPTTGTLGTITGTVTDASTSNPIPYAGVALLQPANGNTNFVGGTVADASGTYHLTAPYGSYFVIGIAPGYVMSQMSAPSPTIDAGYASLPAQNFTMIPATCTATGLLSTASGPLRGVQAFVQSGIAKQLTLVTSDNNGNLVCGLTSASDWQVEFSHTSLRTLGVLSPQTKSTLNTSGGSITGPIGLTPANALLYGTLTGSDSSLLAGVGVGASDAANNYESSTTTDSGGNYTLLAYSGSGSTTWYVNADSGNAIFTTTYSVPPAGSASVSAGNAYAVNLVAPLNTASLAGTATQGGVAQSGLLLDLSRVTVQGQGTMVNYVGSTTTDGSGHFSFGVSAGTWQISLNTNNGVNPPNLVGPVLSRTVADGDTLTGLAFPVLTSTATVSGQVLDPTPGHAGVANANVWASATIGGVLYAASAQTDSGGNYSLAVADGSWTINVYSNTGLSFQPQVVTVAGTNHPGQNITASAIWSQPASQSVTHGGFANFNASVNAPGSPALQWQLSTDGGTAWIPVPNSAPYNGTTTNNLNISPANISQSGYQFRLRVSYTYNGTPITETSSVVTLTVTALAPNFTQNPNPQTTSANLGTGFSVQATGSPYPTFQWQVSTNGGGTWSNLSDGGFYSGSTQTNLNVMNPDLTLNGHQYRCVATNAGGSVNSTPANLTVNALTQSITNFNAIADQTLISPPVNLPANTTQSNLPITYTVTAGGTLVSITGTQLSVTGAGTGSVTVQATQPGNNIYAPATPVSQTFNVTKAPASVMFNNLTATYDGTPKAATASTTPGGLTVYLSYTQNGVGVSPVNAGAYSVTATVSDATYQGSASGTFTINQAGQSINFFPIPDQPVANGFVHLTATATSKLTVTYSLVAGAGIVSVRADQAGDGNYQAATSVDRSFNIISGFAAWQNANFTPDEIANAALSGPNAVYGQDGLSNLVKYALGLPAKTNATTGRPVMSSDGTNWIYTYTRATSASDVTVTVELSTNLTSWSSAGLTPVKTGTAGGFDTWQVTYPQASAPNAFFRLNVTH